MAILVKTFLKYRTLSAKQAVPLHHNMIRQIAIKIGSCRDNVLQYGIHKKHCKYR